MIKILIVAHGPLAEGLKESARLFFGDIVNDLNTLGLFPSESPEMLQEKIKEKVVEIDEGDGVLIFVDIFAGSPFNMTAIAIDELKDEHTLNSFTGVNMPLLMEALSSCSSMNMDELTSHLEEVSSETIINVRKALEI